MPSESAIYRALKRADLIVYLKEATEESNQASLHVAIKNLGDREIRGVTICAATPDGIPQEIQAKFLKIILVLHAYLLSRSVK
jgi:hypothetical protein